MSLQLHIYRQRAGLLEEDKKALTQKIKDFIEDLNQAKIAYMHESNASKD